MMFKTAPRFFQIFSKGNNLTAAFVVAAVCMRWLTPSTALAATNTSNAPAVHSSSAATNAPAAGSIVPAPPPRQKGLGFSGPGAIHGPQWFRYNEQVTGAAVKEGLIPNLKPLIP